ncbi:hypothetical protein [Pseudonocardia acidicola]|uniref:Uncharacterized protein n=1 Tax=Pseudonocardia acidicola TaxID=2724939 RepID=A0ABX1SDF3_9PSEU|nr:hypothetical protein [Pseudonocardia acidicola]NMH98386.1 hypothetical protein [Pseudonocardia acidicola]
MCGRRPERCHWRVRRLPRQERLRSARARLGYVCGRLLGARGDLAGAEDAFARARAQLASPSLPYGKTRVDFARGLTLRRAGRRRDAAEVRAAARRSFAALGAQLYVERCDRELKTGRPATPGTGSAAEHLTEQVRTVAAPVASARSRPAVCW